MSSIFATNTDHRKRGFSKLWLLICKNTSVTLAHRLGLIIIIVAPIVLFLYSQIGQFISPGRPIQIPQTKYPQLELTPPNLTYILYSPTNFVLGNVIKDLAANLGGKGAEPYLYAADMEIALKKKDSFVGIEFEDNLRHIIALPPKLKIALRFPLHLRTNKKLTWPRRIFKRIETRPTKGPYEAEGFLVIQAKLSESLIRTKNQSAQIPQIHIQPFPTKKQDFYSYLLELYNKLIMLFSFMFMAPSLLIGRKIVGEKQRRLREIMRVMGLPIGLNWLSWFIVTYIVISIPTLIIVFLMKWCLCPFSSIWVLLLIFIIYMFTLICFTFMITAFVTTTIMATICIFLAHVLSFFPYYILSGRELSTVKSLLMYVCINSAMPSIFMQVLGHEMRGVGAQMHNIFRRAHPDDKFSIGVILLIMMATNIIRIIICLYVDQLIPGDYGRAKKWYFPFQREFWCPWERPRQTAGHIDEERPNTNIPPHLIMGYGDRMQNAPVIVETENLCKYFGLNAIVRNFNLKCFQDEITVLLGHNGAGKSTTINMIAGIDLPTSGKIFINGYNLATSASKARRSVSLCAQKNVLFEDLSPHWHIVFFSRLKGYSKKEAIEEARNYMTKVKLTEKANIKVKNLSAGMRRKVSLCCALCAKTSVVLCDEPTSWLDPTARRDVLELLRMEKFGRCILLSTQSMDAAEVLGDRIAIMCEGEMYGYGTSEYLINNLGPGYRLVCIRLEGCDVDTVTKFLELHTKEVSLEAVTNTEIIYRLPIANVYSFQKIFRALERELNKLRISSFGITAPTLGETFIKISTTEFDDFSHSELTSKSIHEWAVRSEETEEDSRIKRCINDWHAMFLKNILYSWSNRCIIGLIIAIPLFIILLTLSLDYFSEDPFSYEAHPYNLLLYPDAVVLRQLLYSGSMPFPKTGDIYQDYGRLISERYELVAMLAGATVHTITTADLEGFLLNHIDLANEGFGRTYVAAVTFQEGSITTWFNRRLEHGAPLSLSLIYNAMAYILAKIEIEVISKPRPDSDPYIYEAETSLTDMRRGICVMMYLSLAMSTFILQPIQERVTEMKHQQLMSGISQLTYWLTHLLWDYLIFLLMSASMLIALHKHSVEMQGAILILVLAFALSALSFTYLTSCFFKEPGLGVCYLLVINLVMVFAAVMIYPVHKDNVYSILNDILMVLPHYAMFCAVCYAFKHDSHCFGHRESPQCNQYSEILSFLWIDIIYMLLSGILFFCLVLLFSRLRVLRYTIKRKITLDPVQNEDEDVQKARINVNKIVHNEHLLQYNTLVCDRATKLYGENAAVNRLSLNIGPSECFGLLGLNGAGKSSAIKMIVGNSIISGGNIFVKGFSVKNQLKKCYYHMTYCPQHNVVLKYMTGVQMLRIVCLSSGFKKRVIPRIINHLAECFMLTNHLNQKTKHYSVGILRKLSIAMAVLGRSLVCLDEPTTGVDIRAQHEIWSVLNEVRELGKSILLTSHSVLECEALCTYLAIMVNGQLLCIGSVQHLKTSFNQGVSVKIQVATKEEMAQIIGDDLASSDESLRSRSMIFAGTTTYDDSTEEQQNPNEKGVQANIKKSTKISYLIETPSQSPKPSTSQRPPDRSPRITPTYRYTSVSTKDSESIRTDRTDRSSRGQTSMHGNASFSQKALTSMTALQTKFSDSSFLSSIRRDSTEMYLSSLILNVERKFKVDFPDSYVQEKYPYRGLITIRIPDKELKWSMIFRYMEKNRNVLQIKHYSISQTTLEDIFLHLTKTQNID